MQGKAGVQGTEVLDGYIQRCRAFLDGWVRFSQIIAAFPSPSVNKLQLETMFLQIKSSLAREHQILRNRLGPDCRFSDDIVNIIAGATTLESIYSQSEVAVRKLHTEWHRAFITINETLGNLEDKRGRALAGERVTVGGVIIQIKKRNRLPIRQVLAGLAVIIAIAAVPTTLYVMRHFFGFWAPGAGDGIVYSEAMTDEDKIKLLLSTMKSAVEEGDIDTLMTAYSDAYSDEGGRGKTDLRALLQAYKVTGGFAGSELVIDKATIQIEGDFARIEPVHFIGQDDQLSMVVAGSREGDRWLIKAIGGI
jgi:hypothetical protein